MTKYEEFKVSEKPQETLALGKTIRKRRKQMKLTIAQMAKQTGLTVSFLSQVERGKTGISINSLRKISEVLGVPIFHFLLEEHDCLGTLVRKNERKTLHLPDSHLRYELLVPDLNRSCEFWIGYLEPGAASSDEPMSHPAEECLLVLEGVMELQIGQETHILYPGDSISYDGRIPHRAISRADEELVFVSAVVPPIF